MKRIVLICLAAALAGCATVTTVEINNAEKRADGKVPIAAIEVSNTCWEFLTFLPVASGDPERPNRNTCRWFTDTTTVSNQLRIVEQEVARLGAKGAVDVVSRASDESFFILLFLREKIHTTATLVK